MAALASFLQGESITIGFALPIDYDLARIDEIKVYLGTKLFEHTITDNIVKCQIKSVDTKVLLGNYNVNFWLDDSTFGVKKQSIGYVNFNVTGATATNESVNNGFNILANLSIEEETITVENIFYNYFKGADGDDGNGIVSTELISTVGLVKTYRQTYTDGTTFDYEVKDGDIADLPTTLTPEAIDFDLTPSTDPNTIGRLQWNPDEKTLEFGVEGGSIDVNKEIFDYYVDTNDNLVEGNVVSVTGINGNRQAVTKTNNTDRASATACIGMVTNKNADGTVRITKKGRVRKLNTAGMTEGLPVYANSSGGFTQTAPTAPNYFIHLGVVEVAHSVNGIIDIDVQIVYNLDDASNVDGTDTTIADTDEVLKKDTAGLWKKVTWANVKVILNSIYGRLATINTWALLQTFTSGIKSALFQDLNGNNPFVSQNGGTIYHTTKWFAPASGQTLTVSSDGLSVTLANPITNFQFTSGMPLAKLTVSGYERIINTFTSASVVTLTTALPSTLFNAVIAYTDWGVTSRERDNINGAVSYYGTIGSSASGLNSSSNFVGDIYSKFNSAYALIYASGLNLRNDIGILWSSTTAYAGTKDTGLSKITAGILQIYDGVTSGTYRDLALRYLYQSIGTSAGDAVGDFRISNQSGVSTTQICTVANAAKGAGTWKRTSGINEFGGQMISLTNKTGANSVKGTVVYASATTDNAFNINPIDGDMPIGIVYENAIADGGECWVVVSGIAEVLLVDSVASTRSYVAYSSGTTAGRIDTAASVPAAATHFREVGHTLESKTAGTNILCKCILHFN